MMPVGDWRGQMMSGLLRGTNGWAEKGVSDLSREMDGRCRFTPSGEMTVGQ